ncbi:MAG: threonylcarbamoyl-AMP synthase [Flavobacteriales bacterium]|nr:threonylcarbamoyl-AMP synthase [Bacteroidota bacterium]MCB9239991.1 threonylcarbamoyl-AMP synthase [Flavobacteriales bacterium]
MAAEFIQLHQSNPDQRRIRQIVAELENGQVIILPTDTVYALVCTLDNRDGIDRICKLLGKKPGKANLSLLCRDLSDLSEYCRQIPNPVFKLMKHVLPGPFTFILNATNAVAKRFRSNKKTVGIRVPESEIVHAILSELNMPLVSSSIHSEDEILDYITDPEEIYQVWQHQVSMVIDGGAGSNIASTVLDCTENEAVIIREGMGMDRL